MILKALYIFLSNLLEQVVCFSEQEAGALPNLAIGREGCMTVLNSEF